MKEAGVDSSFFLLALDEWWRLALEAKEEIEREGEPATGFCVPSLNIRLRLNLSVRKQQNHKTTMIATLPANKTLPHEYQDALYGKNTRVLNKTKIGWRDTVSGNPIDPKEIIRVVG